MASRALAALLALTAALLWPPPAPAAETPTPVSYLDPYNMDWLAYIDPADIPPNPYAICVVDTGVAVTPDTPADNPAGPIVKRYAFDGGTGEPQTTNSFGLHGTRMAMAAAAPINDWGTVGAWPGARIISMRATKDQEQFIRLGHYHDSTFECVANNARAAVVLWSLSCAGCQPTSQESRAIDDAISFAHARGASVVAAAGNTSGGVHFPAGRSGVFSVSGGDAAGGLCANSAYDASVAVTGPGCPVQTADPLTGVPQTFSDGGSSTASAVAATLLAALRSLKPDSTYRQAEAWVSDAGDGTTGVHVLDGMAAARRAGLAEVVDHAVARMPMATPQYGEPVPTATETSSPMAPPTQPPPTAAPTDGSLLVRLPVPNRSAFRVRLRHRLLHVQTIDRPRGAVVELRVDGRQIRVVRTVITLRVARSLRRVDLRYVPSGSHLNQSSRWLLLRRRSNGHFR